MKKCIQLVLMILMSKNFVYAFNVNIDPQREDTYLQVEQTRDLQFEQDKNLQNERTNDIQFREDPNLQWEQTRDLQFEQNKFLQQERDLNRL